MMGRDFDGRSSCLDVQPPGETATHKLSSDILHGSYGLQTTDALEVKISRWKGFTIKLPH